MAVLGEQKQINIYFNETTDSGNEPQNAIKSKQEGNINKPDSTKSKNYLNAAAVTFIKQTASTLINNAVGNVQLYTGSSDMQAKANFAKNTVYKAMGLGVAYASNIFVGLFATVGMALNYALEAKKVAYQNRIENKQTTQTIRRAGANFNKIRLS